MSIIYCQITFRGSSIRSTTHVQSYYTCLQQTERRSVPRFQASERASERCCPPPSGTRAALAARILAYSSFLFCLTRRRCASPNYVKLRGGLYRLAYRFILFIFISLYIYIYIYIYIYLNAYLLVYIYFNLFI